MEYLYIIKEFVNEYMAEFIMFLYVGFLIMIISLIISNVKYRKILNRYNMMIRDFNGENLEELILYLQNHVNELNANVNSAKLDIKQVERELSFAIQSIGYIRYNAFDDMGSEMSYSIALLDKQKNGFVLTSIYGRNNNVNYAKDIKNGISTRNLSAEEIIAVDRALKSKSEKA